MKRQALAASVCALAVTLASAVHAEPMGDMVRGEEAGVVAEHAASAAFGLDGAFALGLGASTGVARAGERLSLSLSGDVMWAAGDLDLGDMRGRMGARIDAWRRGPFRLRVSLAPTLRTASTLGFSSVAIGTELHLAPGVHTEQWSGEIDLAVEQVWLTHVAPSAAYRAAVYDGACAGWYGLTARTFRAGVGGAVRIRPVEIALRFGVERTATLDFLPGAYGSLSAAWLF